MSDIRIIVWFTWFLATNWIHALVVRCNERIANGVKTMKKALLFILPLMLVAAALLAFPSSTFVREPLRFISAT